MKSYFLKEEKKNLIEEENFILPEKGEVRTKVLASGINRRDIWILQGLYPGIKLPTVLGSDAVVEFNEKKFIVNPNINWGPNPKIPSHSYNILGLEKQGTFSEELTINPDRLHLMPKHLTIEQAGVLGLSGLTAYRALISNCQVNKNDRVFINGIGGAVALFAMQFALAIGAEVHVSSSSNEKITRAKKMGAVNGTNYLEKDWGKEYKKSNGGIDVIIDSAGGDGFKQLINLSNIGARIGIYGGTRGTISGISPQHLFFKQIHIFGSTMGNDIEFGKMIDFIEKHEIIPVIDKVFPLSEVNIALEFALNKDRFGKVCLSNIV